MTPSQELSGIYRKQKNPTSSKGQTSICDKKGLFCLLFSLFGDARSKFFLFNFKSNTSEFDMKTSKQVKNTTPEDMSSNNAGDIRQLHSHGVVFKMNLPDDVWKTFWVFYYFHWRRSFRKNVSCSKSNLSHDAGVSRSAVEYIYEKYDPLYLYWMKAYYIWNLNLHVVQTWTLIFY